MADEPRATRRTSTAAITLAAVLAALLAALVLAPREQAGASAAGAAARCAGASEGLSQASRQAVRRRVRCLLNEQRAGRGLGRLDRDLSLQLAAQRHSKVMGDTDCLAHRCEGEAGLEERLRKAGYLAGAERWRYAESTGCAADPEEMVASWMASDYHRVNILGSRYAELGVGVVGDRVRGRCPRGYATFAVVFGWRQPAS